MASKGDMRMSELDTDMDIEGTGVDSDLGIDIEEQGDENSDSPYAGLEPDELAAKLMEKDEELSKAVEQNRHLQSVSDKHYNESQRQIAELKGMMQGLQGAGGMNAREQADFDRDLADKIANDTSGESTLEVMRGMFNELRSELSQQVQSVDGKLKETVVTSDPVYRENREAIDRMSKDYGVPVESAIKIFAELAPQKVKQPGKVGAPGRTADNTRTVNKGNKQRRSVLGASPIGDAVGKGVLVNLGLTEEEAKLVMTEEVE